MRARTLVFASSLVVVTIASVFACTGDSPSTGNSADAGQDASFTADTSSPTPGSDAAQPGTDAGTDAAQPQDSGVDAGPTGPTALGARLVLWLVAEKGFTGDGGGTLVWKDQSGAGNDAVQENIAFQPALLDGSAGGVGGKATVHFGGSQFLQIADQASLQWAASDYSVFVVERHINTSANYAILYAKWTDTGAFPGAFLWADYPTTTGFVARTDIANEADSIDGGYNDNTLRAVGMRRNGSDLQLYVGSKLAGENVDAGIADPAAFNATGIPAFIGGRPAQFQMLQGDISEVVAVKGTLTDVELANLQAYLKAKYAL